MPSSSLSLLTGSVGSLPDQDTLATEARHKEPNAPAPTARGRSTDQHLKFAKDSAGFLPELKRRVDAYFTETGKSRNDNWQMYLKSFIILAWFGTSYTLLV